MGEIESRLSASSSSLISPGSASSSTDQLVRQVSRVLFLISNPSDRLEDEFILFEEIQYLPRKYGLTLTATPVTVFPAMYFSTEKLKYEPEAFTEGDIREFLGRLVWRLKIPRECVIAMVAYLMRVGEMGQALRQESWRPMILASIVLSLKMWKDVPYLNSSVSRTLSLYSLRSLNSMEVLMARYMEWRLIINPAEYESVLCRVEEC